MSRREPAAGPGGASRLSESSTYAEMTMTRIPSDFPNDAPLPSGQDRCTAEYEGARCTRPLGHEHGLRRNPNHHITADQRRWTESPSGRAHTVNKCSATYGAYECVRWPHMGPHRAKVSADPARAHLRPIEWTGNGPTARVRVHDNDNESAAVQQRVGGHR